MDKILNHQRFFYVPQIICSELINRYYDNSLAGHFEIDKTRELVARNYYWLILHRNVKVYVRGYDVCLASKAVNHKPYENL